MLDRVWNSHNIWFSTKYNLCFKSLAVLVLLYRCEMLAMLTNTDRRIQAFENKFLRLFQRTQNQWCLYEARFPHLQNTRNLCFQEPSDVRCHVITFPKLSFTAMAKELAYKCQRVDCSVVLCRNCSLSLTEISHWVGILRLSNGLGMQTRPIQCFFKVCSSIVICLLCTVIVLSSLGAAHFLSYPQLGHKHKVCSVLALWQALSSDPLLWLVLSSWKIFNTLILVSLETAHKAGRQCIWTCGINHWLVLPKISCTRSVKPWLVLSSWKAFTRPVLPPQFLSWLFLLVHIFIVKPTKWCGHFPLAMVKHWKRGLAYCPRLPPGHGTS